MERWSIVESRISSNLECVGEGRVCRRGRAVGRWTRVCRRGQAVGRLVVIVGSRGRL